MGKSEDKAKYKQNKKGTALMIIGIAVIVLLIVFIFFGTAISDFVRNVFSKGSDDASSGGETISSSAVDSGETNDSGDETDSGDRAGYPDDETQLSPDYQLAAPKSGDDIAIINTSLGTMKFKLFPENAPKAVANFSAKAKDGYYNGMSFLYLYEDVLQSDGNMDTIYGDGFEKELSINLHNYLGALGVCNSGDKNSNQFYIVTVNKVADDILEAMSGEKAQSLNLGFTPDVIAKYGSIGGDPTLDGQFTIFGQIYEGAEVIDAINTVQVDENYKPLNDITITSVEIGKY
ncbi:MAG: peptidylprolyl isomerase [Clostridia bacterium]|nr:peptidylprolyl isomerase [Clostridia bacterium]